MGGEEEQGVVAEEVDEEGAEDAAEEGAAHHHHRGVLRQLHVLEATRVGFLSALEAHLVRVRGRVGVRVSVQG